MTAYADVAKELFGDVGHSLPEAEIAAAETRLGRRLPSTLRAHYLTYGADAFNRAHDRLLAPAALRVEKGMLLFYAENQSVFHWAFPADDASDDPPVQKSVDDSLDAWDDDHDRLSQFLFTMLFHHRVRMQPCSHERLPRGAIRLPPLVLPGCHRPLVTFYRDDDRRCILEVDDFNDDDGLVRVLIGKTAQESVVLR